MAGLINLEYRFQQVIILTVLFIFIDLIAGYFNGGVSGIYNAIGVGLVFYNFAWAVGIELLFWGVGTILKMVM